MSYSLIYRVTPGVSAVIEREMRNGHGTAPAVWGSIAEKALGMDRYGWGEDKLEKICSLFYDAEQPMWLRAVLGMTFDYAYIERAHFRQAALDIHAFLAWAEVPAGHVNHWPIIAETMEKHASNPEFPALGIMHTSVGDDLWAPGRDEEDNALPREWDKTWSLYKELEGSTREREAEPQHGSATFVHPWVEETARRWERRAIEMSARAKAGQETPSGAVMLVKLAAEIRVLSFKELLARSSIGQAAREMQEDPDAHLAQLDKELLGWRKPK